MADIFIYDEIGANPWTGTGISGKEFQRTLQDASKATRIDLYVDSPGGNVFDGLSIYNQLKRHQARVVAHIDGLAASAASVIVMAADEVVMAQNAMMMIHDAWGMGIGNATELRALADTLDKISGEIADTYVSRSGADRVQVVDLMAAETWLTAKEAVELRLADSIDENKTAQAYADVRGFVRAAVAAADATDRAVAAVVPYSRAPSVVLNNIRHGTREGARLRFQKSILDNIQVRARA